MVQLDSAPALLVRDRAYRGHSFVHRRVFVCGQRRKITHGRPTLTVLRDLAEFERDLSGRGQAKRTLTG